MMIRKILVTGLLMLSAIVHTSGQSTPPRLASISFNGTPASQVASAIAKLTGKPVVMEASCNGRITVTLQDVSMDEFQKRLTEEFGSQQMHLVNVQDRVWKIIDAKRPKPVAVLPHLVVEIRPNDFLLEKQPVAAENLGEELKKRLKDGMEVWILEPATSSPPARAPLTGGPGSIMGPLIQAKVSGERTYRLFLPPK